MPEEYHNSSAIRDIRDWREQQHPYVNGLPQYSKVLVFVHGLSFAASKMMNALRELHKSLESTEVLLIGFIWPSHLRKTGYLQANHQTISDIRC